LQWGKLSFVCQAGVKAVNQISQLKLCSHFWVVMERIERAVRFYQRALCNVPVNHGFADIGMAQQLFQGYNIDSLF